MVIDSLMSARKGLVQANAMGTILFNARFESDRRFAGGGPIEGVVDMYNIVKTVVLELSEKSSYDYSGFNSYHTFSQEPLHLDSHMTCDYSKQSPLQWQLVWENQSRHALRAAYLVMATEGYDELNEWSLLPEKSNWDAE